ncbi:DUF1661 domain-containing protein [Porphyromonas gulae]|uniref:DUF1661 domain-containing protein n=1 Tax=Porphyromonas gulae TaxID=111105 RepID=UPI0026EF9E1C|nr:DUF1661 domain-containing protein [Porphyromonas gulae]
MAREFFLSRAKTKKISGHVLRNYSRRNLRTTRDTCKAETASTRIALPGSLSLRVRSRVAFCPDWPEQRVR